MEAKFASKDGFQKAYLYNENIQINVGGCLWGFEGVYFVNIQ